MTISAFYNFLTYLFKIVKIPSFALFGLSKVALIKPKRQKTIHAQILLPKAGIRVHSSKHKIPAKDTVTASISIAIQGTIAPLGRTLPTTIGITE